MVSNKAPTDVNSVGKPRKRKEPPSSGTSQTQAAPNSSRNPKRAKVQDARTILTQASDAALSKGELNLGAFLKAREFEIKALEDGMKKSKGALTSRAFQQVPRDLRRRTASHNVKRVPKRLRNRATREMKDDNTPTVDPNKRKPRTSRGRIRAETAKRLGALAAKKTAAKQAARMNSDGVTGRLPVLKKRKKNTICGPPKPVSKFKKRQIHKTWLPTHMYHTKRAKMTEPKKPLWRFAIPLTPTQKNYRPTHRASGASGALCWDMSYLSTIGLEGTDLALEKVMRSVGISQEDIWTSKRQKWMDGKRSWHGWLSRNESSVSKRIGPATVLWCPPERASDDTSEVGEEQKKKPKKPSLRKCMLRVHPSAFLELWTEVLRISKQQRPLVHVEDLRFEIGSIELTGPGATEALLGILHPFDGGNNPTDGPHVDLFTKLAGLTNAATLPPNAVLSFRTIDPRLRHPPRKVKLPDPKDEESTFQLLETISSWPTDQTLPSHSFFSREARFKASHLPSQKSINRRKGNAAPGSFPELLPLDPAIPILIYTSRTVASSSAQGTYSLLAPWKCILPFWYSLMYIPLSSGGNPRFGGLNEVRQVYFEHGQPWFPADFPGTDAGWSWEIDEREKRRQEWERRPKGKRVEWTSLDLRGGRKGEIGVGWASDWEWFLKQTTDVTTEDKSSKVGKKKDDGKNERNDEKGANSSAKVDEQAAAALIRSPIHHLPTPTFQYILSGSPASQEMTFANTVTTVRITLFSRGVPEPCARIYRLPSAIPDKVGTADDETNNDGMTSNPAQSTKSNPSLPSPSNLRAQWLALLPTAASSSSSSSSSSSASTSSKSKQKTKPQADFSNKPTTDISRRRALAQSFLDTPPLSLIPPEPEDRHPMVPHERDLIGFVTTGAFNLAEGKGTAVGSLWVERVVEGLEVVVQDGEGEEGGTEEKKRRRSRRKGIKREGRICIVRNAGESVGRLGIWEAV